MHYSDALRRAPDDSRLQYANGLIHYKLGNYYEAERYITAAIERATTDGSLRKSELVSYQTQLDAILAAQLAGLN